jgi:hypothetical protein
MHTEAGLEPTEICHLCHITELKTECEALRASLAQLQQRSEVGAWNAEHARADRLQRQVNNAYAAHQRYEGRLARLREALTAFVSTAEAAVDVAESRRAGGQQVPYLGDFASMPPSALSRLRWWAQRLRTALEEGT